MRQIETGPHEALAAPSARAYAFPMNFPRMLSISASLALLCATVAAACPNGSSARATCPAHKSHAHSSSASVMPPRAAETPAALVSNSAPTTLAVPAIVSAPAAARGGATNVKRCTAPYGAACDGSSSAANHGSCCEDGQARSAHAPAAPAPPARHNNRTAASDGDAPAFGPLFIAHRTLML